MRILLVEDAAVEQLAPMTRLRPAYRVACGGWNLHNMVQSLGRPVTACVRPALGELARESMTDSPASNQDSLLIVNARLAPTVAARQTLEQTMAKSAVTALAAGNQWAAVWLPSSELAEAAVNVMGQIAKLSNPASLNEILGCEVQVEDDDSVELFSWPHDVLRIHAEQINATLEYRAARLIESGGYRQVADRILVADDVRLHETAVLDARNGWIIMMPGAEVGPLSFLRGPVLLGPNSRVNEQASIKDGVMLGDTARVGGEVHASILECFSNKQHHGFLGNSYVGCWVNLGAGTTNSNLKNTYGTIRPSYSLVDSAGQVRTEKVDTGQQFLGVVVGDYVKTAINASIYTGLNIGVCSNIYGTVTGNVPPFVNFVGAGKQMTSVDADVTLTTMERMYVRRGCELSEAQRRIVHEAFRVTEPLRAGVEAGPPRL